MKHYVTHHTFDKAVEDLAKAPSKAVDTETTGLYPYHGDQLFSVSVSIATDDYYFNFQDKPDIPASMILPRDWIARLQPIFNSGIIFMHNAKFDMHMLRVLEFRASIICTKALSRVKYNQLLSYRLAALTKEFTEAKSDGARDWIKKEKAYSQRERAGKEWRQPRYDLVPFQIISDYAIQDTRSTLMLGKKVSAWNHALYVAQNEIRLTKTVYEMEKIGVKCDVDRCGRWASELRYKIEQDREEFEDQSKIEYCDSGATFTEVFSATDRDRFVKSAKDNYSFDSTVLKSFTSPLAQKVLDIRKNTKLAEAFENLMFAADSDGVIHTDYDPAGTVTGRFSSSNPNLQNLDPFVRTAIVPRSGFFFCMIDYDQMEYRLMIDYARPRKLIERILAGLDVHSATAEQAGIDRSKAKKVNFGILYGQGITALADSLGVTKEKARAIRNSVFRAAPELEDFISKVTYKAKTSGQLTNWFGRPLHYPKKDFAYKGPNHLIQGGAGDIVKIAMNECHKYLVAYESRLVLNIHDELVFEIKYGEEEVIPELRRIMTSAYPHKQIPLTAGSEFSAISLGQKQSLEEHTSG